MASRPPEAVISALPPRSAAQQQLQRSLAVSSATAPTSTASPRPSTSTLVSSSSSSSSSPAAAAAAATVMAGAPSGLWQSSVGGWVVALSLLAAIRMSREQTDAERLDVSALQVCVGVGD